MIDPIEYAWLALNKTPFPEALVPSSRTPQPVSTTLPAAKEHHV